MKIGILGTNFGKVHIKAFKNNPAVNEITVCGKDSAQLDKIAQEYNIKTTTNTDELLKDSSINVISIALPTNMHARTAIDAMRNGKDVICEIPAASTLDDAERILRESQETDRKAFFNLFMRFRPAYMYLKKMIDMNEYGRLLSLNLNIKSCLAWGDERPLGLDNLPHEICYSGFDFLHWCLGAMSIKNISASEYKDKRSSINISVKPYKDAVVQFNVSSIMPEGYGMEESYEAVFEEASVSFIQTSLTQNDNKTTLILHADGKKNEVELPEADYFSDCLNYSLNKIINKEDSKTDISQAIPALKLVLKTDELIRQGNY